MNLPLLCLAACGYALAFSPFTNTRTHTHHRTGYQPSYWTSLGLRTSGYSTRVSHQVQWISPSALGVQSKQQPSEDFVEDVLQRYYQEQCAAQGGMTIEQFNAFDEVELMLNRGYVTVGDVQQVWNSFVEGSGNKASYEDALQILYKLDDKVNKDDDDDDDEADDGDDDDNNDDDIDTSYLDELFKELSEDGNTVSLKSFSRWEEIQHMFSEDLLAKDELEDMWRAVSDSSSLDPINFEQFVRLNLNIDRLFDDEDDNGDDDDDLVEGTIEEIYDEEGAEDDGEIDLSDVDPYDTAFDPYDVYDDDTVTFLTAEFNKIAAPDKTLSFDNLLKWEEMQRLLTEGEMAKDELKLLWDEVPKLTVPGGLIDFDGFLRLNVRIDGLFDEIDDVAETLGQDGVDGDAEESKASVDKFYEEVFAELAGQTGVVTLQQILTWEDVSTLLDDKTVSMMQIRDIWESLPMVLGLKGEGKYAPQGVDLKGFREFNDKLDALFENDEKEESDSEEEVKISSPIKPVDEAGQELDWYDAGEGARVGSGRNKANTDAELDLSKITFTPPPPSKGSEPKMTPWADEPRLSISDLEQEKPEFDLETFSQVMSETNSAASAVDESDPEIIELRKMVEMADMLEKGMLVDTSWSIAGELGGAEAKQRLEAIQKRVEGLTEDERKAEAKRLVKNILEKSRTMVRCGLDKTEDRDEVDDVIRGYVEELCELDTCVKSLSIAETIQRLNGDWRLVYTTSQNVRFNQGVLGLANVLPTAKFTGLTQSITSDGIVFETEVVEEMQLITGDLNARMYADWEVKRINNFMTKKEIYSMRVFPRKVVYGPITTEADHRWKSLDSMDRLECVYIDKDVRIMRNQGALKVVFVFERV